jgi:hypothetical protein
MYRAILKIERSHKTKRTYTNVHSKSGNREDPKKQQKTHTYGHTAILEIERTPKNKRTI